MKTYLDCFPCFLSQALRAARIATDDEMKIKRVLDKVGMMLKDIPLDSTGDVPLNLETQLGLLTADRLALLMDVALEAPDLVAFAEEVDHISSYQPVPA